MGQQRRLATIMFTDVVGYTAAMARDERHAHVLVDRAHEHVRAFVEHCGGRWLETVGDGSLSAFASASQAVDCALAIQNSLASDPELQLRIGLHVGDVVFSDEGVYGDGVNVASRVHALAPPGGTVVTEAIRSAVRGHANLRFTSLGRKRLKNVEEPVAVYRLNAGTSGPARWPGTAGRRTAMAAAVLVIGLGSLTVFLATSEQERGDTPTDEPHRIAVLPFEHGSGESDEHFADGLTEELINSLAQLKELQVTARTSAFYFKGKAVPVAEIADQLGVDYVVEGMVRRSGQRLRVSAQLIRADEDFHLWSRTYDRELADIFEVQLEIAEKIAETLGVLLDEAKRQRMRAVGVGDIEAFLAYQKGWEFHRQAHASSRDRFYPLMIETNTWFDRAIERAPDFSEAYSARADLYAHLVMSKAIGRSRPPEAAAIAPRAEQLLRMDWDAAYRTAVSEARQAAIDIDRTIVFGDWGTLPDKVERLSAAEGCGRTAWLDDLAPFGMAEAVLTNNRRLTECDPLSHAGWVKAIDGAIWAGQSDLALEIAQTGMAKFQDENIARGHILSLVALGQLDEAERRIKSLSDGNKAMGMQIMIHATRGARAQVERLARERYRKFDTERPLLIAAWLGDRERANEVAAQYDGRAFGHFALMSRVMTCLCGPPFDLDATPNFKQRIERSGLPWPPPSPIDFPVKNW